MQLLTIGQIFINISREDWHTFVMYDSFAMNTHDCKSAPAQIYTTAQAIGKCRFTLKAQQAQYIPLLPPHYPATQSLPED